jgi:hypothetical protein
MFTEFLQFSKVSLALLGTLVALYTATSLVNFDVFFAVVIRTFILVQIVILVNFELWLIYNKRERNHSR